MTSSAGTRGSARGHRLGLCLIVRDESTLLPRCLESVRGVVDEIVVVDTGSTDDSKEIATRFGARVVDDPWREDFSAPRNRALAESRAAFVLVLDADERLTKEGAAALRQAVERGGFDLATIPLYNSNRLDASDAEVLSGAARDDEPVALSRVFRKQDGLRWTGVVHESVEQWVLAAPRVQVHIEAPVVHVGYCKEIRDAKDKTRRNTTLLERQVEASPDDPVPRTYLARERHRAGRIDDAVAEAERAWTSYRKRRDQERRRGAAGRVSPIATATLLGYLWLERRRFADVLAVVTEAQNDAGPHPNLDLLAALAHERVALAEPAAERRRVALQAAGAAARRARLYEGRSQAEILPGATSFQAEVRLGVSALLLGSSEPAAEHFAAALRTSPASIEARWGLIEARIDGGASKDVLAELQDGLRQGTLDAWVLAALAADRLGAVGERAAFIAAMRKAQGSTTSPHRSIRAAALLVLDLCAAVVPQPQRVPAYAGPGGARPRVDEAERAFGVGDADQALRALAEAARLDPFDPVLWVDLAVILASVGRWTEAAPVISLALRLAPTHRDALWTAHEIDLHDGRATVAAERLRHLIHHHPGDAEARAALRALGAR